MTTQDAAITPSAADVAPRTMMAMVRERYGTASEVFAMREVPVPDVGADHVMVEVHASSVNALEWHLTTGKPYVFRAVLGLTPRHLTLGADISGTVVAVGDAVTKFDVGDHVLGSMGAGAYAQYAVAPERLLVEKPEHVGFEESAAVGVAGLTALQGLRDIAGVMPGDRVLIIGASGGVGTYAIQIAKLLGGHVTAVCSTHNVDQAQELGADAVIDYTRERLGEGDSQFDVIFDGPGSYPVRAIKRLLAPGGRYLNYGGPKHDWIGPLGRMARIKLVFATGDKIVGGFTAQSNTPDLEWLRDRLASGQLRSVVEEVVPLPELGRALDRQGRFHARAKTVVAVKGAV